MALSRRRYSDHAERFERSRDRYSSSVYVADSYYYQAFALFRRAVFLISQKMTDNTVDVLLDLAHRNPDPDAEVREQAVFWLHQVDPPEALDALESILTESDDQELQERAIFAISQRSGDGRAAEILKSYAMRRNVPRELRENAIFWISQNPEAGGADFLLSLIRGRGVNRL